MNKSSSKSSKGVGNTKQPPKRQISAARHWEFTLNNYSNSDISAIEQLDSSIVPIIVGQSEVGDSGTPHLQVTFSYGKNQKGRPLNMLIRAFGHNRASIRKVRNVKNTRNYCHKDDTHDNIWRYARGWSKPVPLATITYDILDEYQKSIADFFKKPADPRFSRDIYWFYEREGNMGKTILSTFFYDQRDACLVGGKASDCFLGVSKYLETHDGQGPQIVIIDIPRSSHKYVSYTAIEKIKDGLLFSGKYESKPCRFNRCHVICFGNEEPNYSEMSEDRWKIIEFKKDKLFTGGCVHSMNLDTA